MWPSQTESILSATLCARYRGGWMGLGDDVPHTSSCREQGRWARAHLRDRGDALVLEQFVRVVTSDDLALVVVLSAGRACGQGDDGMAALKSHRRPLINHGGGRLEHRRESLLVKKGHDLRDLDVLGAIAACVLRLCAPRRRRERGAATSAHGRRTRTVVLPMHKPSTLEDGCLAACSIILQYCAPRHG